MTDIYNQTPDIVSIIRYSVLPDWKILSFCSFISFLVNDISICSIFFRSATDFFVTTRYYILDTANRMLINGEVKSKSLEKIIYVIFFDYKHDFFRKGVRDLFE